MNTGTAMATAAQPVSNSLGIFILEKLPETNYELTSPLHIEVEQDDLYYIVSEAKSGVHSYDADLGLAIRKFVQAFVSNFELLQEHEGNLSDSLNEEMRTVKQFVRLKNADARI